MAKVKTAVQVVEKNEGTKIPYRVSGTKIFFGEDDDLMLNLQKRQREYPVYMDVCADSDGNLVIGTGAGRDYVAQVEIPAFKYAEPEEKPDGGTEGAESGTASGGAGASREPLPIDMADVTVTLWSIDGINIG